MSSKDKHSLHFSISFLAHFSAIAIVLVVFFYRGTVSQEKFTIKSNNNISINLIAKHTSKNSVKSDNNFKTNTSKAKISTQKIKKDNLNNSNIVSSSTKKPSSVPILNNKNLINYIPPIYPQASLLLKEQGSVSIMLLINQKGEIVKNELHKSSGHKRLDDAVLDTAKMWSVKTVPLQASWVIVTVNFIMK